MSLSWEVRRSDAAFDHRNFYENCNRDDMGPVAPAEYRRQSRERATVWRSSRSRLLTSNFIPCEVANSTSNLGIFLRDAANVGPLLSCRPQDSQASHLGKQRGSFQSQFRRCAARSTDDPDGLLKCFHNQGAIGVFQGHR